MYRKQWETNGAINCFLNTEWYNNMTQYIYDTKERDVIAKVTIIHKVINSMKYSIPASSSNVCLVRFQRGKKFPQKSSRV